MTKAVRLTRFSLFQIDEFICQVCGLECNDETEDDQLKLWIGCDLCWRWSHYKCPAFKRK